MRVKINASRRRPMKTFLLRFFTWWNGQTLNTQVWTWLYGEKVGEDESGNIYYRTKGGKIDPVLGFERRWVIYNGYAEASTIPPSWHGWMHHTVDTPPTEEKYKPRAWQKPHKPNLTGTPVPIGRPARRWCRAADRRRPATTRLGRQGANPSGHSGAPRSGEPGIQKLPFIVYLDFGFTRHSAS